MCIDIKINKTIKSFLNNMWSPQYIKGQYVIFCKPAQFRHETAKQDEYIVWNSNKDFESYHTHILGDYKFALELVNDIYNKNKYPKINGKEMRSYLRVIDMLDDLWIDYINLIFDKGMIVHDIKKIINNEEHYVKFDLYHPCPSCGGVHNDTMPSAEIRCCHRCDRVWWIEDEYNE